MRTHFLHLDSVFLSPLLGNLVEVGAIVAELFRHFFFERRVHVGLGQHVAQNQQHCGGAKERAVNNQYTHRKINNQQLRTFVNLELRAPSVTQDLRANAAV